MTATSYKHFDALLQDVYMYTCGEIPHLLVTKPNKQTHQIDLVSLSLSYPGFPLCQTFEYTQFEIH